MNRRLLIKLLIAAVLLTGGLYALVRLDNWNALRQVEQTPLSEEPSGGKP